MSTFQKNYLANKLGLTQVFLGVLISGLLVVAFKMGVLGLGAAGFLLFLFILTPLLINKNGFFLFLWLFIAPSFDNFQVQVAGTNLIVLIITGLTVPYSLILLLRDTRQIVEKMPFTLCLLLFNLVLFLNFFRPDLMPGVPVEFLRLFFEIIIIYCYYNLNKQHKTERLFTQVNYFIILNSLIAILQRVTGVGLMMIEGVPRVGGLVGHPNCLAFLNVLYLPFAIHHLLNAHSSRQKQLWLAGVFIATLALMLTLCKNVIFTMFCEYFILFLFLPAKLRIRAGIGVIVFVCALIGMNALLNFGLFDLFAERFGNNSSMDWRHRVWGYLLNDIDITNIWLGHGVNAAKMTIQSLSKFAADLPVYTHNVYIQILYENGLTGLFLLASFIQPTLHFLSCFVKQMTVNRVLPLLILFAIFINMATDNSVMLRTPMSFAWLFIAYFYLVSIEKKEIMPPVEYTPDKPGVKPIYQ
jgi:hypothetical protein